MNFLQIGTKDGNDDFNLRVRRECPLLVILVEPNRDHNASIYYAYDDIPVSWYLENVAITTEHLSEVTLVHPAEPVNGVEFDSGKFSLLPMDDWGDRLVQIKSPSMTFNDLCRKYGITHIDFLQIDTEGYDAEIIKSIDFDKISIDEIKYEQWNFPPERFTRHGAKGKNYGTAGMAEVERLLTARGYKLDKQPYDIIAKHE